VLTAVTSVVIFLQLILFANTTAFFHFLLRFDSYFEKATAVRKLAHDGVASTRAITYAIVGFLTCKPGTMAYKPDFHAYRYPRYFLLCL